MSDELIITRELPQMPFRPDDVHKGDVGRLMVVGGCAGQTTMFGAVALTTNAALRSGAGLVRAVVPEPLMIPTGVLAPCATYSAMPHTADGWAALFDDFAPDVLAIGPGLGDSLSPASLVALINSWDGPLVLDADGLNTFARSGGTSLNNPARIVMTPHPGEMARLLEAAGRGMAIERSLPSRRDAVSAFCEAYGATVVLKGHHSLVSEGTRLYINQTGNPGMATAGAGDVLTGVIAALIGQGVAVFEAAVLGTYLHGLAGDFAAEELPRVSMTAIDLIEYLPESFTDYESSTSDMP